MTPAQCIMAFWMLVTGSINTISTKYADMQCVPDLRKANPPMTCSNSTVPAGAQCPEGCETFDHPFVQAAGMFVGELLCMFAFKLSMALSCAPADDDEESSSSVDADGEKAPAAAFPVYIFAAPALCDCLGTSVMYLGLTRTYASVFQMLRGSVVVFTGVLSVLFLRRRLQLFHWTGMALVMAGAFVVGVSALSGTDPDQPKASNPALGNMLIVSAQLIVATQMVLEEKFLSRYKIHPLQAVGWEGFFGLCYLSAGLAAMYFLPFGNDVCDGHACVENTPHAIREAATSAPLALAIAGNVLSIAFFNYFGVSVTQSMSATHRMVLDSVRTMVIWAWSLAAQWQAFDALQVLGFAVLIFGTLLYNEIVRLPCLSPAAGEELRDPLMLGTGAGGAEGGAEEGGGRWDTEGDLSGDEEDTAGAGARGAQGGAA